MIIYIPTYGRVGKQFTWKSLTPELREKTFLVCPSNEVDNHEKFSGVPKAHIVAQPPSITTISEKRRWISSLASERGYPKFLMMDDDLELHARWHNPEKVMPDGSKGGLSLSKRGATPGVINSFFAQLEDKLDTYAHVGISARQTNTTQLDTQWGECQRMMYAFGYRTEVAVRELEFGRVKFREDFDYTLQLLRKGYKNVVGFDVCVDPKQYGAVGGCSKERTMQESNSQAELLASLHPEFVKVKYKEYKTSIPRAEVNIAWKKAFASSQAKV